MTQVFGSILAQPVWKEFVSSWQRLQPVEITATDPGTDVRVSLGVYRSHRGRLVVPHHSPYAPVTLEHSAEMDHRRLEHRWLTLTEEIGSQMLDGGVSRPLNLPPGVVDVRGIQQSGFRVESRFTSIVALPWSADVAEKNARRRARKAEEAAFEAGRGADPAEVLWCLKETEKRKRFTYLVSAEVLALGVEVLGRDRFRFYCVRDGDGRIVCARVVVCSDDGLALGWMSGTSRRHLGSGAQQLMTRHTFEDLSADGFTSFDWAGVNIPSVANAKQQWGGQVMPFTSAFPRNAWDVAQLTWHGLGSRRRRWGRKR